jgi:hypothetical protein
MDFLLDLLLYLHVFMLMYGTLFTIVVSTSTDLNKKIMFAMVGLLMVYPVAAIATLILIGTL